ncbi:MAG: ABC transporter ATP-binding protein [Steroidobacteraceae bacterium]
MLTAGGQATETSSIVLKNVECVVGGRRIFHGLNLAVARGRITAIMGPSGTGKTTLLRLITGQVRPERGEILVDGEDVAQFRARDLYRMRLNMGVLFQEGALFTDLDAFENVAFPLRQHTDLPEGLLRTVVLMKLHAVGLRGAARLMPAELSGGMARRVALARAMALEPRILLCDEPFVGLDPISTGVVLRLLKGLNEGLGMTTVVVSHDVAEVEAIADMSCILANGVIAASGRPAELRGNSSEVVRQFINGLPEGPVAFHYPAPDYLAQLLE